MHRHIIELRHSTCSIRMSFPRSAKFNNFGLHTQFLNGARIIDKPNGFNVSIWSTLIASSKKKRKFKGHKHFPEIFSFKSKYHTLIISYFTRDSRPYMYCILLHGWVPPWINPYLMVSIFAFGPPMLIIVLMKFFQNSDTCNKYFIMATETCKIEIELWGN